MGKEEGRFTFLVDIIRDFPDYLFSGRDRKGQSSIQVILKSQGRIQELLKGGRGVRVFEKAGP